MLQSKVHHVRITAGTNEKVASDLGLDGGFHRLLFFRCAIFNWLVTTLLQYGRKSDENQNSNWHMLVL